MEEDNFEWLFGPLSHDADREANDQFVGNAAAFLRSTEDYPDSVFRLLVEQYEHYRDTTSDDKYTMTGAARYVAKRLPGAAIAWATLRKLRGEDGSES